jgi:hypothetical protein
MMTPVLLATRWTVMGSVEGRGGGPAGRAPRRRRAWSQVSGLGRVRSSSRVAGLKNIRVFCSIRMLTSLPPGISAASSHLIPLGMMRSTINDAKFLAGWLGTRVPDHV